MDAFLDKILRFSLTEENVRLYFETAVQLFKISPEQRITVAVSEFYDFFDEDEFDDDDILKYFNSTEILVNTYMYIQILFFLLSAETFFLVRFQ